MGVKAVPSGGSENVYIERMKTFTFARHSSRGNICNGGHGGLRYIALRTAASTFWVPPTPV